MELVKLLVVVNGHAYTAAHRLPLLAASQKAGYVVHVAAPLGTPAFELLADSGYRVHGLHLSRQGLQPWEETKAIHNLVHLYRKIRPELVQHATIKPVLYGSLAARIAGVPAVVNAITGLGYIYTASGLRVRCLQLLVNRFYRIAFQHRNQKVIFQNTDDRAFFEDHGILRRDQSVLIRGSGVDTKHFHRAKEDPRTKIVIMPGRILWNKGVGEFIQAARIVKNQWPEARFCLVGGLDEGNPSAIPESIVRSWVREGVVEWWGETSDMQSVYRIANIVILPSYREGLPKVLLEASSSCRAVITTDSVGCRDAVVDGLTGYIVPVRNVEALAIRIGILLSDAGLRERMGLAGRDFIVENFSTDRVIKATLAAYNELIPNATNKHEVYS